MIVIELWKFLIYGFVVVIGNVLIVLFYLLELLDEGMVKFVLILGFFVGFVGVVELKVELVINSWGVLFIMLYGWWGGSVIVVAVVNVLVKESEV